MKKKESIVLYIILISLLIVILIIGSLAVSMNKTKIDSEAKVGIAKPIIEFESVSENISISESSENVDYCFRIKNYEDNKGVNQIAQKFTLQFSTENEDNINRINYSLFSTNNNYDSEELINLTNNKSEPILLNANEKEEKFFKVKINDVDSINSFKDSLSIDIVSESIEL